MALTDTAIRALRATEKPIKKSDGGGLFLFITPKGGKWWRFQYRMGGKQKLLSFGVYPDVGLKEARERRDEARKQLVAGIDPGENRKAVKLANAEKGANTFEVIAREWISKHSARWTESNKQKVTRRLEKDVFPWLGKRPITDIEAVDLKRVLDRVEARGTADTAHRILQSCGQVFRYAVASGRIKDNYNPCPNLKGALTPVKKKHFAAITDPKKLVELLRAIQGYQGSFITRCALRIAPLVMLRPGELRNAEWKEFNLQNAEWNIPAMRMKVKTQGDHIIPLSRQVVEILNELIQLTGNGRYVFPGARSNARPMSDGTINAALRRLGFSNQEMVGHGFRATARTIMDEVLDIRSDLLEHQLHHSVRDPNGRAYNRTAHLQKRRVMLQQWADYLDTLAAGGEIIPFSKKSAA